MILQQQSKPASDAATSTPLVVWFEQLGRADVPLVGGKNASLGEMVCHLAPQGVRVPSGFATTADAYWRFVDANALREIMSGQLAGVADGTVPLAEAGAAIRRAFVQAAWPADLAEAITSSYQRTEPPLRQKADADVAVRSSATAEDLPDASFAGQQESFLNIRGVDRAARRLQALLRLAVHRPRHRLSAGQGLRSPENRAVDRHPEHGALGSRRRRRHVLDRHRDRLRQGRGHQRRLGARRKRRAGRRRSRRISRSSSRSSPTPRSPRSSKRPSAARSGK